MAKLYWVTCEVDLMIVADSEDEAADIGERLVSVEDAGAQVDAHAVEAQRVLQSWKGARPFGNNDDSDETCEEWLAKQAGGGQVDA